MLQATGMFRMRDEMGIDDKVLCVAVTDPRMAHLRDIEDVSELDRLDRLLHEVPIERPGEHGLPVPFADAERTWRNGYAARDWIAVSAKV
jgi:hypothetical protein